MEFMTDTKKLAMMFELAQEQQKSVKELIETAKEIQRQMEYQGLNVAKMAVKAVEDGATKEVKGTFEKYDKNLEGLILKASQANQALESATKNFSYKLIAGFAIFAFACTLSLFGVSFWLIHKIEAQRETVSELRALGGDVQLSTCNGKPCIKVQDKPTYGDGGEYRIIVMK